jgi:hypothetical protein
VKYEKRERHCRVPEGHIEDGLKLNSWVQSQRVKKDNLSKYQLNALNKLNFIWNTHEENWVNGIRALAMFTAREGHANVLNSHNEGKFRLGNWLSTQRQKYAKCKLTDAQISALEHCGVTWNKEGFKWQENIEAFKRFKDREGHTLVPASHVENGLKIGFWVMNLRQKKKKELLEINKISELEKLNFVWDPHREQWNHVFDKLKAFKNREGHCRVVSNHKEDGFSLGQWVFKQRKTKDSLPPDFVERLDALGFVWDAQK